MRTLAQMLCLSAFAACHAPSDTGTSDPAAPAAPVLDPIAKFTFPNLDGEQSFDLTTMPNATRLDFLKQATRAYIANRLNGVATRHAKDEAVAAWNAYDTATKADPLQTAVPKPTADRPAEPNYKEAYDRAVADLVAGNVRRQSDEPKVKKAKDPLTSIVTNAVEREVYESKHAADPKYTYLNARKDVGGDGIKYLNDLIDAKVEGGADRAQLEAMREAKYLNPARAMLGINALTGKAAALPSIL